MGGGNSTPNYKSEVDQAQSQANQPQSELAKQLSSYFGSLLPQTQSQISNNTPASLPNGGYASPSQLGGATPQPPGSFGSYNPHGVFAPGQGPQDVYRPGGPNYPSTQTGQPTTVDPNQGTSNGSSGLPQNPFSFLGNNNYQAGVIGVGNSGMQDPRLTGNYDPSVNPQTGNSGLMFAGGPNGLPLNYNPQYAQLNQVGGLDSNVVNSLQNPLQNNIGGFTPQSANINGSLIQDNGYAQAVQQILGQQQNQDIADLRARFGAAGGTSQGTPAAYAEAQLRAQQTPQIAAALGQIRQNEAGLNLQDVSQMNNSNLAARGQNIQNQSDLNSLGSQNLISAGNLQLGQGNLNLGSRGQDLSNFNTGQQNSISQLGLGLQQNQNYQQNNQFNAGQYNSTGLQNRQLTLQDMNNQYGYNLGLGNINSGNAQFNAGQNNTLNQNYANNYQSAQQNMLNNQSTSMNQLAAYIASLASQGMMGGSFNAGINVGGGQPSQGNTLGSILSGAGQLAQGASSVYGAYEGNKGKGG